MSELTDFQAHTLKQLKALFNEDGLSWLMPLKRHQHRYRVFIKNIQSIKNLNELSLVLDGWCKHLRASKTRHLRAYYAMLQCIQQLAMLLSTSTNLNEISEALKQTSNALKAQTGLDEYTLFQTVLFHSQKMPWCPSLSYVIQVLSFMQRQLDNQDFYKKRGYRLENTVPAQATLWNPFNWAKGPIDPSLLFIKDLAIVFVSGGSGSFGPHGSGHALLYLGEQDGIGYYVHTNSLYGHIEIMDDDAFSEYMADYGKVVVGLQFVDVPYIDAAQEKLEQLCAKKWLWWSMGGVKHNCLDFVREVLQAGGANLTGIDKPLSLPIPAFQTVPCYHHNKQLFDHFKPSQMLRSNLVEKIPLEYHSKPRQVTKLIDYVCANTPKVMQWQTDLRVGNKVENNAVPANELNNHRQSSAYEILRYIERKILTTKWKLSFHSIHVYKQVNETREFEKKQTVSKYMIDMLNVMQKTSRQDAPNWEGALAKVTEIGRRHYQKNRSWHHRLFRCHKESDFLIALTSSNKNLTESSDSSLTSPINVNQNDPAVAYSSQSQSAS